MKNKKQHNNAPHKKAKFKPGSKKRENKCIVTFDDDNRQEYLTGFHKRKVERRKAAVVEIQKKIKEEHARVREQRHKEYIQMLKERTEALGEEDDDLEEAVTDTTECVQYDHPNHTVTVTTISNLDLTDAKLLGLDDTEVCGEEEEGGKKAEKEYGEKRAAMPKQAHQPILNKKIRSLSTSLNAATKQRKGKHKREGKGGRGRQGDGRSSDPKVKVRPGRTSKRHRRQQTGKRQHYKE